ncbi:hypothetical protein TOK_5813 [Pseudonocardia sp. N23]|nr:hypothetical protein TOK_5813 [Pseudonocardia sp. N23]
MLAFCDWRAHSDPPVTTRMTLLTVTAPAAARMAGAKR